MAFKFEISDYIYKYCNSDLPDDEWYEENFFPFIKKKDNDIWNRLVIEHRNARTIYKIFEGLQAENELLLAQIKTQIIMYVSIQEEVINYILFKLYDETNQVVFELTHREILTRISIPETSMEKLKKELNHDNKDIIPCYYKQKKVKKNTIKYENKVKALVKLELIDNDFASDLITLYEFRNTVHLEAEMKKGFDYNLKIAKLAYRRVEGLSINLSKKIPS